MALIGQVPWLAAGSVGAGIGTLVLMRYLYRYRGRPGANWFLAALTAQALFCLSYGLSLLVFDPEARVALEAVTWIGLVWIGPLFLAFALEYTGWGSLVRSWLFAPLLAVPLLTTAFVALIPYQNLLWTDFRFVPAFGVATVQYTFEPWGYVAAVIGIASAAIGVLLLLETILSYGPLYRREAAAVALSTLPPATGLILWLFELGPLPHVNFGAILFLPHVVLDGYAFIGTNMFDSNPTTRRAAERTAIDDLETAVVVLDTDERVVNLNSAAQQLFAVEKRVALGTPFVDLVGTDLDDAIDDQVFALSTEGRRRQFTLSASPLTDPRGIDVGRTVVFQDVTRERRREQRLGVLNRVLRHNLRNEMTVIRGYAQTIRDSPDAPQVGEWAETIDDRSGALLDIGEKAREFEQLVGADRSPTEVDVHAFLETVSEDIEADFPNATVELTTAFDGDGRVTTDRALFDVAIRNVLEATLEYTDSSSPTVRVRAATAGTGASGVEIAVSEDGVGIPDSELAPLREGTESALEHGSGIGLWIAQWSATALGGDLTFETDADGTTVVLSVPGAD